MKFYTKQKGFTLIELLVVIAIIGILASVVLASLSSARAKARDTARAAEAKEAGKAMQIYYTQNGDYYIPPPSTGFTPVCMTKVTGVNTCWNSGATVANNGAFESALIEFWPFPEPSNPPVTIGANTYSGMIFRIQANGDAYIQYANEQGGVCAVGTVAPASNNLCNYQLN